MKYFKKAFLLPGLFITGLIICAYQVEKPVCRDTFHPLVKQDSDGNVVCVWLLQNDQSTCVQAAYFNSYTKSWSCPTTISNPDRNIVGDPRIVMNQARQIVVSWESYLPDLNVNVIELSTSMMNASWSDSMIISTPEENVKLGDHQILLDEKGNILAIWSSGSIASPTTCEIKSATGSFDGIWSPIITLSD